MKDIESGNFDTFKGDELYLKMYLRKIAKYLGLEEKELDADFGSINSRNTIRRNTTRGFG
ncbi:helix-turn-helix domain-containing protein [Coprobacillaceae bacterium CR2/5/TPMF4]|nr:helix-turn-helix domain-containing protein [Coprobacillaceae bacterium CR2/5/TPMF4]